MSLKTTKEQLIQLLNDNDNCVIALSGKWGTGKTHLWQEVRAESDDQAIREALYISLFGLSSSDQFKRKLIESAIPKGKYFDSIQSILKMGVKAASAHYKALSALNEFNLQLMAPAVLPKKIIVIDDIERKHDKLGIDEILGFIDEYSNQHSTRFVLVLNDDKLKIREDQFKVWSTFREKIIDHEVKLSTTAEEAFSIAISLRPSNYAEEIKKASVLCGLTNIRIIVKTIRTVNQILAGRSLQSAVLARVVPSVVLFCAIHFRGLEEGPDLAFVLNMGSTTLAKRDTEQPPKDERIGNWQMLIHSLGISRCDEFEERLVEFLESGLIEQTHIERIIDRYVEEQEKMEALAAVRDFLNRAIWDYRVSEEQLVTEARELIRIAGFLDPITVTELQSELSALSEGHAVGEEIINSWITAFRQSAEVEHTNLFNRPLHPKIQDELDYAEIQSKANTSVTDACFHLLKYGGWGTLQEVALKRASAADFESAIREMEDLNDLRFFMRQMIKMRTYRQTYDPHFGTATEYFLKACRTITNDPSSPRLAKLVQRLFSGTSIESELNIPEEIVDATSSPAL